MACSSQMEIQNAASGQAVRVMRISTDGVGARVIRGPDWKWGKQVNFMFLKFN